MFSKRLFFHVNVVVVNLHFIHGQVYFDLVIVQLLAIGLDNGVFTISAVNCLRNLLQVGHLVPLSTLRCLRHVASLIDLLLAIVSFVDQFIGLNHSADATCGVQGTLPARQHVCLAQSGEARQVEFARAHVGEHILLSRSSLHYSVATVFIIHQLLLQ